MATNELLRFANGENPNIIPFLEWKDLPEITKGFVSGIAKSANLNRVFAQGALAGFVMGQAIVNVLKKDAKLDSPTFYDDFMLALTKYVPSNIEDGSIDTSKLKNLASLADVEAGTAKKIVCADVIKAYLDTLVPRGTCQCFLAKSAPKGWLVMDQSRIEHEDAPEFVELLWQFNLTRGDGSTYGVLPNMNGRVFQGTTNVAAVCTYLEAELPNITGTASVLRHMNASAKDAFIWVTSAPIYEGKITNYDPGTTTLDVLSFMAKRVNGLYKSNKLQPSVLQVLPCIRV